jgi:putative SOS response-associated peptidase YedK
MCYHTKLIDDKENIELKLKAHFLQPDLYTPTDHYNGFSKPLTPVILNIDVGHINMVQWGFLTSWQPAPLLNAKIETLETLKTFKDFATNRCIVIVNGFYDWRHEGKNKIKFEVGFGGDIFCLGGIYKVENNTTYYTIVTTEAQGIMREIHNSKMRMPIAFNSEKKWNDWLHNVPVEPDWDFVGKKILN